MTSAPQQLRFAELEFDADRTALTVGECARKLGYTQEHIISAIECGDLVALNCATSNDMVHLPRAFALELADKAGLTEAEFFAQLSAAKMKTPHRRPSYRIPPSAWSRYLQARTT